MIKTINNIKDVREILELNKIKVFGLAGNPILRSEAAPILKNYETIYTLENKIAYDCIKPEVNITNIPVKNEAGNYTKKPEIIANNHKVEEYINKAKLNFKKIGIYIMKPTPEIQMACKKNNWQLIGNEAKITEKLNNKLEFKKLLKRIEIQNEAISIKLTDIDKKLPELFKQLGDKIVVQLPEGGGGHGTFFINKGEKDIQEKILSRKNSVTEKITKETEVVINRFFKGPTLSVLGTITKDNGIIVADAQHQLIDIEEVAKTKTNASGIFCGHDWTLKIQEEIQDEIAEIAEKIGIELKENGALGIFGVDFLWDKPSNKIIPIEINVILTGVYPAFTDIQIENNQIPILAFHILDFMGIKYKYEKSKTYRKKQYKNGANLIIFNTTGHKIILTKNNINNGIYEFSNYKIKYKRKGYKLSQLQADNEFLIVHGDPEEETIVKKNSRILKIITKRSLAESSYELNNWAKNLVSTILKTLNYKKA